MATNAAQIPNPNPGTTVIVMNQRGRNPGPQYLRRGTTCCNGCHVSTCSFFCILLLGLHLTVFPLALLPLSKLTLIVLPFGLFLIGLYIYLLRKAIREFNALPPDHPDRLKYSGFDITQLPVNLNPSSNQSAAPPNPDPQVPPPIPGQNYVFPQSSFPQNPNYPGQDPSAPPPESYLYSPAHGPYAPPQGHYPPPQGPYPPPQGPYPPPQGPYAPPQGPYPPPQGPYPPPQGPYAPPSGYYPHPAKNDDDPPPYSAI